MANELISGLSDHLAKLADSAGRTSAQIQELLDLTVSTNVVLEEQQKLFDLRLDQLETLTEVAEILTSSLDVSEVLQRIVETAARVLRVRASTLRLLEEDGELRLQATYNLSKRYLEKGPVTAGSRLQRQALRGETVYVEHLEQDARSQYPREAAEEGLYSMLCTGLHVRGRAIGTMSIYTGEAHQFSREEVRLFEALANQAALAIEQARLHTQELKAHELSRELEIAGQIQMNLIPDSPPISPGLDIAARIAPYREVSGDFYDFIELPNQHLGFVIADVSGKSVPGALLMAETRAVLRTEVQHRHTVRDVVTSVNRFVTQDTRITEFITLFYGVLNLRDRVLTYTNAGHVPPMLFRGARVLLLEEGGVILGFQPDASYAEAQIQLQTDDLLLCVTDGVIEGFNSEGEIFSQERLEALVRTHRHRTSQEIVELVYDALSDFTDGHLTDDLTVLVIRGV